MLRLEQFSRSYGHTVVIHPMDLHIHDGEVLCLMGPNGAGKTSLIEAILSHNRPSGSKLHFRGKEIGGLEAHNWFLSRCSYLGHEPGLIYDLTALENLQYFADFHCADPPGKSTLRGILGSVGLGMRADDPARIFSRGMRQRLGLARCLLHEPDMVFLDEPLTGLDHEGVHRLLGHIDALRKRGASALIVTHDDAPFMALADRFLFLNRGHLVADIESSRYNDAARKHVQGLLSKDDVADL